MEWSERFANKVFITDLGESQTIEMNGKIVEMGRYAAFSPNKGQDGHQIIEVSMDCGMLCEKYRVTQDRICALSIAEE